MLGRGIIAGNRTGLSGALLCIALAAIALFLALTSSRAALPNDSVTPLAAKFLLGSLRAAFLKVVKLGT